eukprot:GHUV01021157.1.p1 GENE.GHUV01021157.1~~GHUV01021157.1.p1  ORF type:complete len:115 (-),score=26.57 GHUV01021157.1:1551-1895(-)
MAAAMAAPEDPGLQPQPMSNWASFFYFVAFVLVVAYTLLNLYIGGSQAMDAGSLLGHCGNVALTQCMEQQQQHTVSTDSAAQHHVVACIKLQRSCRPTGQKWPALDLCSPYTQM